MNISVKVIPNASVNQISVMPNDVWRVKIAAPPDKGKANKALIEFLSDCLAIRKDNISLIRGHSSRNKILCIEGLTAEEIIERLSGKS